MVVLAASGFIKHFFFARGLHLWMPKRLLKHEELNKALKLTEVRRSLFRYAIFGSLKTRRRRRGYDRHATTFNIAIVIFE